MPNTLPSLATDLNRLAILLDVDGTLLDLAPTPQSVSVPPPLRETLARLGNHTGGALAFVSGRKLNDLDLIFTPLRVPAIGGHGAEMRVRAGAPPEQTNIAPLDPAVKEQFAAIAAAAPGIIVEDKGYSLALHYRLTPQHEDAVRKSAEAIRARLPPGMIELLPGKAMVEIKPAGFNKGSAVRKLMTYPPFAGRRPLFIGDDVTDEDVFAVMPDFHGIAISVGKRVSGVTYCFDRPADVRAWLEDISRNKVLAAS